jgi:hypothetical protein
MQQPPEQQNGSNGEEISAISVTETNGAGRPSKYNEQTIARICDALADGMPLKAACAVANVGVSTLSDWRKADPELEARIDAAKEKLRQKCLQTFSKALEENDWRAADALMKLVFPEYRQNSKVEVSASASSVSFPTLTPEVIASLQERRKQLLAEVSR